MLNKPGDLRQYVMAHQTGPARHLAGLLLLTIALPACGLANAVDSLPGWREVSFEQHSAWGTARSTISIVARNDDQLGAVWVLRAQESIAENRAQETQQMAPGSGYLLRRSRLTSGKNTRLKEYQYATDRLARIRREPDSSPGSPPARWPVSSRRAISYPALEEGSTLTSMHALLLLADRVMDAADRATTVYVHGDLNFYRVRLAVIGEEEVEVDYSLAGGQQRIKGARTAIVVGLQVDSVGTPQGDPEFSLLGLGGRVSILLDGQSRLPLQVRGEAPLVGRTYVNLVAAEVGPPAVEQSP